ncbi:MAG: hypothetical protein VX583_04060 [Bdellovibrionota bacterium]|mgnify:FL=1|nr:hypothetical protein [Pseudobdellovibrionaceae bacterium]|tara:strand:- start:9876 stop:10205 length:330 start_codon:yes stop_codon:yes gene_type:complete
MKFLFCAILFWSINGFAQESLECKLFLNGSIQAKSRIALPLKNKTKWTSFEGLEFSISGPNKIKHFVIEIFNPTIPSRSYIEGELEDQGDSLAYASWTRSSLLEVKCSR